MPSHTPLRRAKALTKLSRTKKTSGRGRLSAARARVKAELKKGTYKTVKHAATVIAPDFNVSPASLRVSMSRNKIRNEAESLHHGNHSLTKDEEEMLLAFVLAFDTASIPLRNKQILDAIFNGFKKQVSKSWICHFKTKHAKLLRTTDSKGIETALLKATPPEGVQDWLDRYHAFMEFHSFRGHARFNADETRLIPPKAHSRVTAAKGQKELNKNNKRETRTNSVGTLVPFISADGGVFMSFYVIKDKKEAQFKQVIPKESKGRASWPRQYAMTKSGFVGKPLWREIMYAFEREYHLIHPGLDCIVFMDNCAVHRDDFLDLTDLQNNLILDLACKGVWVYFLPPNTTAWLQPLDDVCFGNLKRVLGEERERVCFEAALYRNADGKLDLQGCYTSEEQAFTPGVIKRSWVNTGMSRENDCTEVDSDRIMARSRETYGQYINDPLSEWREQIRFYQVCILDTPTVDKQQPVSVPVLPNKLYNAFELQSLADKKQAEAAVLDQEKQQKAEQLAAEKEQKALRRAEKQKQREQAEAEKSARKAVRVAAQKEAQARKEAAHCRGCNLTWRNQSGWLECNYCELYSTCAQCSKTTRLVQQHERKCGKRPKKRIRG